MKPLKKSQNLIPALGSGRRRARPEVAEQEEYASERIIGRVQAPLSKPYGESRAVKKIDKRFVNEHAQISTASKDIDDADGIFYKEAGTDKQSFHARRFERRGAHDLPRGEMGGGDPRLEDQPAKKFLG